MRERIRQWLREWLGLNEECYDPRILGIVSGGENGGRFLIPDARLITKLEDEIAALKARLEELESPFGPIESKPKPEPEPVKVGMGMVPLSRRKAAFEQAHRKQADAK